MKNIKGGECNHTHRCNDCFIDFVQLESSWTYQIDCDGEASTSYSGSGQYGGTFCGGSSPCGPVEAY